MNKERLEQTIVVNLWKDNRAVASGEARDPNSFNQIPWRVTPFEGDTDYLLFDWDGNPGAPIKILEYVFLDMAEKYLDKRWNYFMQYKGVDSVYEISNGDSSYYFKKIKLSKAKSIARLKEFAQNFVGEGL